MGIEVFYCVLIIIIMSRDTKAIERKRQETKKRKRKSLEEKLDPIVRGLVLTNVTENTVKTNISRAVSACLEKLKADPSIQTPGLNKRRKQADKNVLRWVWFYNNQKELLEKMLKKLDKATNGKLARVVQKNDCQSEE